MPIRIISIGKKHESWVKDGVLRYEERLKRPFNIEWVLLPHSAYDGPVARQEESGRILKRINDSDFVVLMDEKGQNINSTALSRLVLSPLESSKNVVIIIGGAYGVDDTVTKRADFVWSLSQLVFPHQLVLSLIHI